MIALGRILAQQAVDHLFKARVYVRNQGSQHRGRLVNMRQVDGLQSIAGEGLAPRKQFEESHAQRVQIAAGVAFFALDLFRRHIERSAQPLARPGQHGGNVVGLGDPEIQHDGPAAAVDPDVRRLQVAMHHVAVAGPHQRLGHLPYHVQRFRTAQPPVPVQIALQILPLHIGHDQVMQAGPIADIEDFGDIGMPAQRGGGARLLYEPGDDGGLPGQLIGQDFYREQGSVDAMAGQKNFGHPTAPDPAQDLVFFTDGVFQPGPDGIPGR